jgi:hypothetical protein
MKTEFTLRVVLSETLHANLTAYANRTGLSMSNVTRCFLAAGLDGKMDAGELDRLIAKLEHRRAALRTPPPPPKSQGEPGEGGTA